MPPIANSSLEIMSWGAVPGRLMGKLTTLDEIRNEFPENDFTSEADILEEKEKYFTIGNLIDLGDSTWSQQIAYQCKTCNEIRYGPPETYDWDDFRDIKNLPPLCGSAGYKISCGGCGIKYEEITTTIS